MKTEALNSAKVLYELAIGREDVEEAARIFDKTPLLRKTLENPVISGDAKNRVIDRVFSLGDAPEKLRNFIKVMTRLGRADELEDIFRAYYKYWDTENHVLRAELIRAEEPLPEQKRDAESFLRERFPGQEIILEGRTDPALLGGFIIRAGGREYDKSYAGRLRQMEQKLTGR